jgi:FkbM family methyltransferase
VADGTRAQASFDEVVRHGVQVLRGFARDYEPALWRRELFAQLSALVRGRRAGYTHGRDHDRLSGVGYRPRRGGPTLWLRHGGGDAAVYGEIFVRDAYAPPWPLPERLRVLDLGGHVGYFARWALLHWNVESLVSVEPDAGNFELLERNRAAVDDPRWTLVRAAAACSEGEVAFAGGRGAGSGLSAPGDDRVATIDALELLEGCDFAKLDIEGGEWPILRDRRFGDRAPAGLVVEYHAANGVADPATEARRLLEQAGYEVRAGHRDVESVGLLWARRPIG